MLALAFSLPVHAVTLKIATVTPEGTQWMKDMRSGAKEIKERRRNMQISICTACH